MLDVIHHVMEEDLLRGVASPNVESPMEFISTVREAIYTHMYGHEYASYRSVRRVETRDFGEHPLKDQQEELTKRPQVQRAHTRATKPYVPPTSDAALTRVLREAPLE